MVKPAMPIWTSFAGPRRLQLPARRLPVSGEYSMIHAAAANGWMDLQQMPLERPRRHQAGGRRHDNHYFAKDVRMAG